MMDAIRRPLDAISEDKTMSHQEGESGEAGAAAGTAETMTTKKGRIPLVLVPVHYDLWYQRFCLKTFRFEGVVTIQCQYFHSGAKDRKETFDGVSVHAADLQLTKAEIRVGGSGTDSTAAVHRAVEFRHSVKEQVCEIRFDRPVEAMTTEPEEDDPTPAALYHHLTIHFAGCLNDQMRGLYRSSHPSLDQHNKEPQWIFTTQMEPTDARRAFPCFDEPALKATFQLRCTVPAHLQCLSNTPIASSHTTTAIPGTSTSSSLVKTVTFQTTPQMSTYLVALVVGQFDSISSTGTNSVAATAITTTVYTVPGKAHQAEFCLDVASRCLDLFQDLFQVPYPLPKSDLVAIPDFAAGAMENWGLVTYREAKVLVQPGASSESARRGIARTICHELAHQWFGNLVTPEFWTQLWLKEGAARFLEFVATDSLFPDWNMWTEFVQSVLGLALHLDAMTEPSSHPVEVEVSHPDDINDIFDAISYAKGASIIRMISHVIGRDDFFLGMRRYLEKHAYGNAVTNDLWGALEEASHFPVVEFMAPWTLKAGFPILELDDDGKVSLRRFLAGGREESTNEEVANAWPVPVTALVSGMEGSQGPWILKGPGGRDDTDILTTKIKEWSTNGFWFKLNVDQTGFYRVSYTSRQWERLAPAVNPTGSALSTSDRLGLVSDSFAAGRAGYCSLVDSLRLVSGFGSHKVAEYAVWQELSENLAAVASLFRSESFYPNLQQFLRNIYGPQLRRLGWEAQAGEDPRVATLRALVIAMLGRAGDAEVASRAFELLVAHSSSKGEGAASCIAGDLQETVFRCALRHDETQAFAILLETYERSTFPEEQRNALSALGCVTDPKLHSHMLEYTLFSGKVRRQDIMFPLGSLSGASDEGGVACWRFFTSHYDRLYAQLGSGPMWPGCVGLCCRGLRSPEEVEEVERFFASHEVGSAQRRLTQALEVVQVQIRRRARDRNSVERFLSQD